ncbi:CRS2-associated factor 2, mitochondrial [Linum perenne]
MLRKLLCFPDRVAKIINNSPPYFFYISNLSAHSQSEYQYDPPFSLISNSTKSPKPKPTQAQHKPITTPADPCPKLPVKSDLPFDFRYSYSEHNPAVKPIGFREKKRFSPFGPRRLDREWTGTAAPANSVVVDQEKAVEARKGGVTHNMLDDIHNHWKRAEAVRIKCLGVPTVDMDNVCFHLEDKSGGKIIYRHINVLLLYRGRNYDPKNRPLVPLMLWKPYPPIYPRLIKNVADGLTFEETKAMRNRGLNSLPLMKLSKWLYIILSNLLAKLNLLIVQFLPHNDSWMFD